MILLLFLLTFEEKAFGTLGAGGEVSQIQANMDVKDLHLKVKIDPKEKTVSGVAEWGVFLKHKLPNQLEWDLYDGFTVTSVTGDGDSALSFQQKGHKLFVDLPQESAREWRIRIEYSGKPLVAANPPWRGGFTWAKTDSGDPWVAVSCQGEGAKVWFPAKDVMGDKIEGVQLEFTVPEALYCAANGTLAEITHAGKGWHTFHWRSDYPINGYNISFGLADYDVIKDVFKGPDSSETPVAFYYLKEYQKADQVPGDTRDYPTKVRSLVSEFKRYLAFYANHYGPFPFSEDKAGVVHTPYLGMEHQTINAYGNHFKMEQGYDWLLLHELGHEWWGNKVSLYDWRDLWIHEGICTYATGVFLEETQSMEAAHQFFAGLRKTLSNKKPIVGAKNTSTSDAYSLDVYNKGALTLHSLRFLLGKALVDQILKGFAMSPSGTHLHPVDTGEFIALAEAISGRELGWFFDQYLNKAGLPQLTSERVGQRLNLSWDNANFEMPLQVRVIHEGTTRFHRVIMHEGKGYLELPQGAQYNVDPDDWVLKNHAGN